MGRLDGTEAVDGLSKRVHHATEHATTDGDVHDAAGRRAEVTLLDSVDVAEEDGADLVNVEVLGKAVDGLARG